MEELERIKILKEVLHSNGIDSCYHLETEAEVRKESEITGAVCRGCGRRIVRILFRSPFRYCEECLSCSNNRVDYEMVFKEVNCWMQELLEMPGKISFCVMPFNPFPEFGIIPITRISFLGRKFVIGRKFIRRDVLARYLVFAYVKFWMEERGKGNKKNIDFYKMALEKDIGNAGKNNIIPAWYMLQYMYFKGDCERSCWAEDVGLIEEEEKGLFKDFEEKYPIHKFGDADDDKEGISNLIQGHPIKKMREEYGGMIK